MVEFILEYEPAIRLSFFGGTLLLVAVWEILAPRRTLIVPKAWRWANNLGITFFNSFLLRFLFPVLATGLAIICTEKGWGLLNQFEAPLIAKILVAIIVQDFVIYTQHVVFHKVPLFWRFHKMHHADTDYDVTTGARFHPVEICLSMGVKLLLVLLLGPPAIAVILFEILLSTMAMFNHANAALPKALDQWVRLVVVTPDMHRVHHSIKPDELNRNFGFNLSIWDRVFKTYKQAPDAGQIGMTIGLSKYQKTPKQSFFWMLLLPFKS